MSAMDRVRTIDITTLVEAYKASGSIQGVGRLLLISTKAPCVQQLIKERLSQFDPTILKTHTTRSAYTISDIRAAVATSICMSDVLRKLGLTTHGACANVIKRLIVEHNIDKSHFDAKAALRRGNGTRWLPEEVFVEHSPVPRSTLHKHVKRFGVLGIPICTECRVTNTYNNKPISLTVDHVNGVSDDNRVENLRWLCPNCHSQTSTYCGKNTC